MMFSSRIRLTCICGQVHENSLNYYKVLIYTGKMIDCDCGRKIRVYREDEE